MKGEAFRRVYRRTGPLVSSYLEKESYFPSLVRVREVVQWSLIPEWGAGAPGQRLSGWTPARHGAGSMRRMVRSCLISPASERRAPR
jgi:hypothetical protein